MNPSTVVTAILAGGHGQRLDGAVKASLVVAGRPLLSRLVAKLEVQSAVVVLCVAPRHASLSWVKAAGLPVTTRYSLGSDVAAACGQLVRSGQRRKVNA